jgi:hypothetical protein
VPTAAETVDDARKLLVRSGRLLEFVHSVFQNLLAYDKPRMQLGTDLSSRAPIRHARTDEHAKAQYKRNIEQQSLTE